MGPGAGGTSGLVHQDLPWTWTREARGGLRGAVARGAALGGACGGPGCLPPELAVLGLGRAAASGRRGGELVGGSVSELASLFGSDGSRKMRMRWWVEGIWWQHGEPLRHSWWDVSSGHPPSPSVV